MEELENLVKSQNEVEDNDGGNYVKKSYGSRVMDYVKGFFRSDNARLYGDFQQRTALNVTQFPKIQGSLLIRMGLVYPIMSTLAEKAGLPKDYTVGLLGADINLHTWAAGYMAYLAEIEAGLSKYPVEWITKLARKVKGYFSSNENID